MLNLDMAHSYSPNESSFISNLMLNHNVCVIFRMPAPQMDGSGPRSELQELQVKANQVADEVIIN